MFINLILEPVTQAQLAGMMALAKSAPVKVPTATLSARITKSAQKYAGDLITNINQTTRDRINNLVNEALRDGLTQEEAAQLLNDVLNDPARAEMIAHTETVSAYSRGRADYADESGAIAKIWHTQSGKPARTVLTARVTGKSLLMMVSALDGILLMILTQIATVTSSTYIPMAVKNDII